MRQTIRWAVYSLGLMGLFISAVPAQGAITYEYSAGQPTFAASPGQAMSIPIYVRETVTSPSTSLIVAEGGLYGAGFSVGTSGTSVSYTFARNTAAFNDQSANATGWSVNIGLSSTGAQGTQTSPGVRDVLLGHLNFNAGGGSTTFTLSRYDSLGGNSLTNTNFLDLDFPQPGATYSAAQGSSFVVAIPEPTGAALLLITVATLLRRRRVA